MLDADELLSLVKRGRAGFQAFAASVDLLGMKTLMAKNPHEARARLDDLQQGFGEALAFYPGGDPYRVCFAGDAVFVIREVEPDSNETALWSAFCGHIYALAAFLNEMDRGIGNAGLRAIVAAGPLFQLRNPNSWKAPHLSSETANWFVLTGASVALAKVWEAERAGHRKGFEPGYCWHEKLGTPGAFLGTRLRAAGLDLAQQPELYPSFHQAMVEQADRRAELEGWQPIETDFVSSRARANRS